MTQDNLTAKQNNYAVFLSAVSGFYATYIGKQSRSLWTRSWLCTTTSCLYNLNKDML